VQLVVSEQQDDDGATDATMTAGSAAPTADPGRASAGGNHLVRSPKGHRKGLQAIDHHWGAQLARASELFEAGYLGNAPDDAAFLRRLNARVKPREGSYKPIYAPESLADAVDTEGRLHPDAELLAFGQWLITEGAPGVVHRGGRQINPRDVLKTLATALAELNQRKKKRPVAGGRAGPTRNLNLTKTILADRWADIFHEAVPTSDFDRRIASLKRLLPAYLDHLRTGQFAIEGKTARKSPMIRKVHGLLGAKSTPKASASSKAAPSAASAAPRPAPAAPARTPLVSADFDPFSINLHYAAPGREIEYRQRLAGALPLPKLKYLPESYQPRTSGKSPPTNRQNHLVLAPDLDIAKQFRVTALFDRMALLISIREKTTGSVISELLKRDCGIIAFAEDRTIPDRKAKDWRAQLPPLDLSLPTGNHFAIMIQEPTAKSLTAALNAIDREWKIEGPITPFLIELAVDFYPAKNATTTDDERLILREQMVAALQRHHWCAPDVLMSDSTHVSRERDARQVYDDDAAKRAPRFLFPRKKGNNIDSDQELNNPAVRTAILNARTGENLMLNATLYHGAETGAVLVRIQHKIGDRRNQTKKNSPGLPQTERRARIEVQITGLEPLSDFGLNRVEDLATHRFRDLRKNVMMFRQPLVPACKEDLSAAKQQLEYRGVYGWELWCRASKVEARETALANGQRAKPPRLTAGQTLVDWPEMNKAVGHALDQLSKRWKHFAWS